MITGIFHLGSGLGNQLFRFVGSRVLALDKGQEHTMVAPELFKGSSFMNLPIKDVGLPYHIEYPSGKVIVDNPKDIEIVDSEFQGEENFMRRIDEVKEWLKVKPLDMTDDLCVIGFRGGEYVNVPDLFLPQEYWNMAIKIMRDKYLDIKFIVHTDDTETAREFFPSFPCIHDIEMNWRSVRYAKHLIIANSSFFIFPALLGEAKEIIAPLYWAGYNKGYWQLKENQYKRFIYVKNN